MSIQASNMSIQQQRRVLQEHRDENILLKQILASHGIPFEAELEQRKLALRSGARHAHTDSFAGSTAHSHAPSQAPSQAHSHSLSQGFLGDGTYPTATPTTVSAVSPGTGSDYTDPQ
ncbi:hypothetical protein RJZ56_008149, partial [Blastomyces dermatitidis]